MLDVPSPQSTIAPAAGIITGVQLAFARRVWPAARRAALAADLAAGRTLLIKPTAAMAAAVVRVSAASARTALGASERDHEALRNGAASLRSLKKPAARPEPALIDH
jgi:hypothetical protein